MTHIPLDHLVEGNSYKFPVFSPDGKFLAYLATYGEDTALCLYDMENQQDNQLTSSLKISVGLEYGGAAIGWLDNSSGMIISSNGKLFHLSKNGGVPKPIKCFGNAISPQQKDGLLVYVIQDGHSMSLVTQEFDHMRGEYDWPVRVKFEADFIYDPIIHPNKNHIIFHAWNNPEMSWNASSLYRYDLATQSITQIAGGSNTSVGQPQFSPDGRYLTYLCENTGWLNLWIAESDGTDARVLIDEEYEHGGVTWTSGVKDYIWVTNDLLVFTRDLGGMRELYSLAISTGIITNLNLPKGDIKGLTADRNGKICFELSNYKIKNQLLLVDLSQNPLTYSVFKNGGLLLKEFEDTFVEPEIIEWQDNSSPRGLLSGLYYKPSQLTSKPPPLIVMAHGGPTGQYRDRFRIDTQYFTSMGWAVFGLNYRGSTGFGRSFRQSLNGNWGIYDIDDFASAMKYLTSNDYADPEKSVIMGGSAGGFVVLMTLARYPGLFKAGIDLFGVSDVLKLAEETHYLEAYYTYSLVAPLPEGKPKYFEHSPMTHAANITDPLLILQGSIDTVVPPNQSELIRDKVSGIVDFKIYDGESHGFKKIETYKDMYPRILAFLDKHVLSN